MKTNEIDIRRVTPIIEKGFNILQSDTITYRRQFNSIFSPEQRRYIRHMVQHLRKHRLQNYKEPHRCSTFEKKQTLMHAYDFFKEVINDKKYGR